MQGYKSMGERDCSILSLTLANTPMALSAAVGLGVCVPGRMRVRRPLAAGASRFTWCGRWRRPNKADDRLSISGYQRVSESRLDD